MIYLPTTFSIGILHRVLCSIMFFVDCFLDIILTSLDSICFDAKTLSNLLADAKFSGKLKVNFELQIYRSLLDTEIAI